ncbi:MAG TPA: SRPBCC family protein [Myxococcaceae bacterium]|nr:SRPBCC family protein [Myxococcaceae bacterium]
MALQIEKTFIVNAAPTAVWGFLTDPRRVARCMPGAAITEQVDERTYAGTITVKVGPVSASYKGKLHFERLDAETGSAEIVASGQEVRGKGGADMRLTSHLSERAPGTTEVTAASQVNVTGILAQFGRGMIQDVSDQIFRQFTEAMRAELEAQPASKSEAAAATATAQVPPMDVLALGASAASRAAGRAVRRPGFWVAVVGVGLFIYWLWFRRR